MSAVTEAMNVLSLEWIFWERYNAAWLYKDEPNIDQAMLASYLVPPIQYFSISSHTHAYVLSIVGPIVKSLPWLSYVEPDWNQNYTGSRVECPKQDTYCFNNCVFPSLCEKVELYLFVWVLRKSSLNFRTSAFPVYGTT